MAKRDEYHFYGSTDYISSGFELIYLKNVYKVYIRDDCSGRLYEPKTLNIDNFHPSTLLMDVSLNIGPNVRVIIDTYPRTLVSLFVYS